MDSDLLSTIGAALTGYLLYKIVSCEIGKPNSASEPQSQDNWISNAMWNADVDELSLQKAASPRLTVYYRTITTDTLDVYVDVGGTGVFKKVGLSYFQELKTKYAGNVLFQESSKI